MKSLLIILALYPLIKSASAQFNIIDASEGYILKSDGKVYSVIADKSKFDSFKEENHQRKYSRTVKDRTGDEVNQTYYIHLDKNKGLERVVSYNGISDYTNVTDFENGKLRSKTSCFGSDCSTVSNKLCKSLFDSFTDKGKLSHEDAFKKLNSCMDYYEGVRNSVLKPQFKDLAIVEETNLKWAGAALLEDSKLNTIKVMKLLGKDANRTPKSIEEEYTKLYFSQSDFVGRLQDLLMECSDFYEKRLPPPSIRLAPSSASKARKM